MGIGRTRAYAVVHTLVPYFLSTFLLRLVSLAFFLSLLSVSCLVAEKVTVPWIIFVALTIPSLTTDMREPRIWTSVISYTSLGRVAAGSCRQSSADRHTASNATDLFHYISLFPFENYPSILNDTEKIC